MNIFGVGGAELLVLLLLAGVLLGPRRIVALARDVGALVRQIQSMTDGLTKQLNQEVDLLDKVERRSKPRPKPATEGSADAQSSTPEGEAPLPEAYRRFRDDFPEEGKVDQLTDKPTPGSKPAVKAPAPAQKVDGAQATPARTAAPGASKPIPSKRT